MSAILPNPIAPAAFAGLVMTKRETDVARRGSVHDAPTSRTLAVFAALEPRPEDGIEPVALLLDASEIKAIKVRAERLAKASEDAKAADQRLVAAQAVARKVEGREARAGALELPTLREEAEEARRQMNEAFGGLRVLVNTCMSNLRLRAAAEYARLAGDMLKCVAVVGSTIEMQPQAQETLGSAWRAHFLAELNVPAMPEQLRDSRIAGVENHNFRDALIVSSHSKLTANESATRSHLHQQLQAALAPAGLRPINVL